MNQQKSILLIEDDQVDVLTVKRALKKLDVPNPLNVCSNGEEGWKWLNDNKNNLPGIILLDLNMPRMGGIEFLELAKGNEDFKIVPIIVLTTSQDDQDRLNSFKQSVAGYMVKPVSYSKFVDMLKNIKIYWENSELAY